MLSNPLHRFSPYQNISSSALAPDAHGQQTQMQTNGLDSLGQGSQYPIQHLPQPAGIQSPHLVRSGPPAKHRQHPYGPSTRTPGTSGPIRRRISRACDQCNQLRTKCDGQHPCAHCIEFGLGCEYIRERKKRGKASRKELAQQAAAQAASGTTGGQNDSSGAEGSQSNDNGNDSLPIHNSSQHAIPRRHHSISEKAINDRGDEPGQGLESLDRLDGMNEQHLAGHPDLDAEHLDTSTSMDLNGFVGAGAHPYEAPGLEGPGLSHQPYHPNGRGSISSYPDLSYAMQAQSPPGFQNNTGFRMGNSPIGYAMGSTPPGWGISMASPPNQFQPPLTQASYGNAKLRYPVLEPLVPHLNNVLPLPIACDLIDLYFQSSSSAQMHPMSPFVLGFLFRKRSFLHSTKPRHCQPALLASMLWVAAQTSDVPFLASAPSARAKTCQKLLELTVGLLKPLIHTVSGDAPSPVSDGVALGGLGVAMPGSISLDALTGESGPFGAAGCLDDVITYIHLAVVVSASEYKGASIRWWNAAWSLARELKLGRELPLSSPSANHDRNNVDNDANDEHDLQRNNSGFVTEEDREERRRIWWLVYIVDRHLALCYNRPLFLLDIECEGLLQPMDDNAWQSGDFGHFPNPNTDPSLLNSIPDGFSAEDSRSRGPQFECRSHSIFGYFLPLMTIQGEIVDLHHAKNHPRFGVGFRLGHEWDAQMAEITRHLEIYEQSLKTFEHKHRPRSGDDKSDPSLNDNGDFHGDHPTPSVHSVHTNGSNRLTESDIQTRIVIAYGTHVMHVLHILLAGKWDPINLLDDDDLWISSEGFITATSHAVAAAEAINQILEFDPGLEFMPFFFGIYLLQGSFLLLLIADKLQSEASPSVAKACETIVRAHEACVVTLNTEYQRKFSKVMRSALAQVRGRVPEDLGEQQQRRRELLALYRWTGDGTGLAL
ncbi:fungal-specific transcription factor domain-containing protein [Dactylonectria estremocensis]|uniref:Fungal-specific transcription factor domain-containing protein n=1 Tax=Dactylonectria estremocensis TaxID=1079267 RepID=A0A9P9JG25_9HYPO|nr:fungal-specific transcription factor domain-containing protein [Dactylonectria estremocensis]